MKVRALALAVLVVATACHGHDARAGRDASAPATKVSDIHAVDWPNTAVPASVCGGQGSVQLHDSYGLVSSTRWPDDWNSSQPSVMPSQVQVGYYGPVQYGAAMADGRQEAVVPIWCTNGGGTADGQLGQSLVVFHGTASGLEVTGIITTTQSKMHRMAYFDNSATRIERGKVTVKELFYGPNDSTCCPTGRAEAVWKVQGSTLVPSESHVTARPKP